MAARRCVLDILRNKKLIRMDRRSSRTDDEANEAFVFPPTRRMLLAFHVGVLTPPRLRCGVPSYTETMAFPLQKHRSVYLA